MNYHCSEYALELAQRNAKKQVVKDDEELSKAIAYLVECVFGTGDRK
jgi:hypothetical protein